jgi:hypothetical protein
MTNTTTQPARSTVRSSTTVNPSYPSKDTTMKLVRQIQLINEALSRARMPRPQTMNSEAIRPARQIMLNSLREYDRMLGL